MNGVPPHVQAHVHSDLLCFVQRKCTILAFDDLVRVCSDLYSLNEFEKARLVLTEYISEKRLPKHRSGIKRDEARKLCKRKLKNGKCLYTWLTVCRVRVRVS